jgi:hypothetical protein
MEKKDKILMRKYAPLVLYLESLEKIFGVLKGACSRVAIETEDYKFESISELRGHFKNNYPKSLTIRSSNPYCKLKLDSWRAEFYVSSSSTESSGVFYEINDILLRSQRRPNFVYSLYFVILAPNVVSLVGGILPEYISDNILFFVLQLFVCFWAAWVLFFVRLKKHSTIILGSGTEKQGFFQRHADQIKLGIIVAIITTAINFAGQELVKKLWLGETKANTGETNKLQK